VAVLALGVMVLALCAYRAAAGNGFVMFDDDINIYSNPMLGSPTWTRIQWAFTDNFYMPRYMPLGWLSLMVIFVFGGLEPSAYHAVNVVLHAANAALVFLVVAKGLELVAQARGVAGERTWRLGVALVAAIFWAVHPLRVEPVSWATGIHYVHATFWGLLATWWWWKRLDRSGWARRRYIAAAWLAYAFSVLVYPVTLGLSGALFLFELWRGWRSSRDSGEFSWSAVGRIGWAHMPLFAVSALSVGANVWTRLRVTNVFAESPTLETFSLWHRGLQAAYSAVYYTLRPLVPGTPTPLYIPRYAGGHHDLMVWLCLIAVVLLLVVLAATWRRVPGFAVWCVGFAFIGVSYYGLLESPFQTSDRYTYFTSVMLALGLAVLAVHVPAGRWRAVMAVLAPVWCGWLALAVPGLMPVWRDNAHLFTHIAAHLDAADAALYKGRIAVRQILAGDRDGAAATMADLRQSGAPENVLRQLEQEMAQIEEASARLTSRLPPQRGWVAPEAKVAYLNALNGRNDDDWTTRVRYERALMVDPGFHDARYSFALWLAGKGEVTAARSHYEILKQANPVGFQGGVEDALLHVIVEVSRLVKDDAGH
jgi:protein O-mannosyl-transferase